MAEYKLYYFYVRGKGQVIRYVLEDNDVSFEDILVPMWSEEIKQRCLSDQGFYFEDVFNPRLDWLSKEWQELKQKTTFGQVPYLTGPDGLELSECYAILRYFGRKLNLYGNNDIEAAKIDMLLEREHPTLVGVLLSFFKKQDDAARIESTKICDTLAIFQKLLEKNKKGEGYFVGDRVSIADYAMLDLLDACISLSSTMLDAYPTLKAFYDRMASREKIAACKASEKYKSFYVAGNLGRK
ncbi:unnamed protein product [Owenia fusiformis]|uniref:Glutathione transferase n=1 Tax=Owenia fusiformis TaxID=6347 RepID=A0A8S4Q6C8_OWEFU|nr:unnamed protein product [Owenia fusiformis]